VVYLHLQHLEELDKLKDKLIDSMDQLEDILVAVDSMVIVMVNHQVQVRVIGFVALQHLGHILDILLEP